MDPFELSWTRHIERSKHTVNLLLSEVLCCTGKINGLPFQNILILWYLKCFYKLSAFQHRANFGAAKAGCINLKLYIYQTTVCFIDVYWMQLKIYSSVFALHLKWTIKNKDRPHGLGKTQRSSSIKSHLCISWIPFHKHNYIVVDT